MNTPNNKPTTAVAASALQSALPIWSKVEQLSLARTAYLEGGAA